MNLLANLSLCILASGTILPSCAQAQPDHDQHSSAVASTRPDQDSPLGDNGPAALAKEGADRRSAKAGSAPLRPRKTLSEQQIIIERNKLLQKYSFLRTSYDPGALGYLVGNAEIGGVALPSGLGFDRIWCADLWANKNDRIPLQGLRLELPSFATESVKDYNQSVSIADGIVRTRVVFSNDSAYESELLFSADRKRVLAIRIKNLSATGNLSCLLRVPRNAFEYLSGWPDFNLSVAKDDSFIVEQVAPTMLHGYSRAEPFTPCAWYLKSNVDLVPDSTSGSYGLSIGSGDQVVLYLSIVTKWDGRTYGAAAMQNIASLPSYDRVLKDHCASWKNQWEQTPLLLIPDPAHEELFYRSIYWLFCTAGSDKFLPGESQFGNGCWNMRPFTYGAAGWCTFAYEYLGLFSRAETMLHNFYAPGALRQNASLYIHDPLKCKDAFCFAHEIRTDGTTTNSNDEQCHLNGFALAMFHRYYQLHPDEAFLKLYLYPVAKGVAEFWTGLAIYSDSLQAYKFPVLRSVSEDLQRESLLDVVLPAQWSLAIASQYAKHLGADSELRARWTKLGREIYIPQNDTQYLEYLGDELNRSFGGYQGVRAPVYLGFPITEVAGMIDREKARRTLTQTWQRNNRGRDMLGFIANWFALTTANMGQGDLALEMANQVFNCYGPGKIAVCEGPQNIDRVYFETTSSSYLIVPICMFLQSHGDEIRPFPATPGAWKDVAFYNLPAAGGIRVSGSMTNGEVDFISYRMGTVTLLTTSRKTPVRLIDGQLRDLE